MDRDGVIIELLHGNEEYGFLYKKEDCHIIRGVPESLEALKREGYLLVVVTNQPLVARGLATPEEVEEFNRYVNTLTRNQIDKFYFCPHHPEMHPDVPEYAKKYRIPCECRKPGSGMLRKAASDLGIDLKQSWVVGDSPTDIAAGKSVGCKTILVKSPSNNRINVSTTQFDHSIQADYKVNDLTEVVALVLK